MNGDGILHEKRPGHRDDAQSDRGARRLPPAPVPVSDDPLEFARPQEWYDIPTTARLCHRTPKTISNLLGLYALPRRLGWRVVHRFRRRTVLLSPATVAKLQALTLLRPGRDRQPRPPR